MLGLALLLLVWELTPGCGAYYNTFYHARKRFQEAERIIESSGLEHASPQAMSLYQQAIDKGEKVIRNFPDSKWVDDARLLIGRARLGREEYEQARVAFQRLIDFHPDSGLLDDARLGIGMSLLGLREYAEADGVLRGLLRDRPDFERADEVLLQLARGAAEQREYRQAIRSYSRLLEASPSKRVLVEAHRGRAEAFVAEGVHDSALADYVAAESLIKEPEARYEVDLRIGQNMVELGRYAEALSLYNRLEREMADARHLPRTLVQTGNVLNSLARHEEALETYERVVEKYPGSTYAAQAQFQIGVTHEVYFDDYELAKEAFAKVRERSPRSEFVSLAELRTRDLELYGEYRLQASGGEEQQQAEAAYKLAELKLLRLRQPEEAWVAFQAVEDSFPTTDFAAKAAYAIGYVHETELADTVAALAAFRHTHETYPETVYGIHAGVRVGAIAADSLSILVGRIMIRQARLDSIIQVERALVVADSLRVVMVADSTWVAAVIDSLRTAGYGDSTRTAILADSLFSAGEVDSVGALGMADSAVVTRYAATLIAIERARSAARADTLGGASRDHVSTAQSGRSGTESKGGDRRRSPEMGDPAMFRRGEDPGETRRDPYSNVPPALDADQHRAMLTRQSARRERADAIAAARALADSIASSAAEADTSAAAGEADTSTASAGLDTSAAAAEADTSAASAEADTSAASAGADTSASAAEADTSAASPAPAETTTTGGTTGVAVGGEAGGEAGGDVDEP